jgi:aquaporin related protein
LRFEPATALLLIALLLQAGEFVGTTLFLFLGETRDHVASAPQPLTPTHAALGGAKTANFSASAAQTDGLTVTINSQTIIFIATSFGLSLLVTAWMFYRITGGASFPGLHAPI